MKKRFFLMGILSLALLSPSLFSDIYTWTDKDGNRHYSDSPPTKKESKVEKVEKQPINSVAPISVRKYRSASSSNKNTKGPVAKKTTSSSEKSNDSCSAKKRIYEQSQSCYKNCRKRLTGGNFNLAKCGHCTNAKKPNC